VTAAGALAHAVLTNVRKRGEIGEHPGEDAEKAEASGQGGAS
jgi:hypothetical protein